MNVSPDRYLPLKIAGLGVAMFAFGFALVPLYDVFCAVTGYGGKTASAAVAVVEEPDASRTVRVEFLSSVARGTPFTLEPEVSHMEVHPGQLYETHFRARNLTGSPHRRASRAERRAGARCPLLQQSRVLLLHEPRVCAARRADAQALVHGRDGASGPRRHAIAFVYVLLSFELKDPSRHGTRS